jgi:4-carboxymuconolactone decarboxylase
MTIRIAPVAPPYALEVAEDLKKLMPPGMEPLGLFRTLAKNPRVLRRLRRGALLDPGSISLRQREIVILRISALSGAEYEWGVHATYFASAAGLDGAALYATVWLDADALCWSKEESLLIQTCDVLHRGARICDALWPALRAAFSEEQLLEVLVLAGYYRAIAYVVNNSGVALEDGAVRFPEKLAGLR